MSNILIGMYDHLNETDPPVILCTMPDLVRKIREMNYGQHRFLCELLRQREDGEKSRTLGYRQHTKLLRDMLEKGFY